MTDINSSTPEDQAAVAREAQDNQILSSMAAAGQATTDKVMVDYFGFRSTNWLVLPDGVQRIQHKALNEGDRKSFQKSTNRDITIKKRTGDAELQMSSGEERTALLKLAICGWDVYAPDGTGKMSPVAFTPTMLDAFLNGADPVVIDFIHKAITKANPWLLAEMSSEDIRKEISELQEMLELKLEEEAGK